MPHNLYLHSGIVQTRAFGRDEASKREALRLATWDSTIALMFALTVNASILILAAVATPPDMMSQIILFCAVYPLYEVSILLMRRHERQVEARMRAEGLLGANESLYGDDEAEGKA